MQARAERIGGRYQRGTILAEGLSTALADLVPLHQHRTPHVVDDRLELALALGKERIQKARCAGVVRGVRVTPAQQTAMLEEHVHELPEHVVEGLDQLLADVAVIGRRLELVLSSSRRE